MRATEQSIFEQFPYWESALGAASQRSVSEFNVFVGCGTSYNLALSLATLSNAAGQAAIAVPAGEWVNRSHCYWPSRKQIHVVVLSRSGETTEAVAAAKASRAAGAVVTAITVEAESAIAKVCDHLLTAPTHPREGIVMTASASLMLLLGIRWLGYDIPTSIIGTAQRLLGETDAKIPALFAGRSHVVYLGAGALYGISLEGGLKLMEMSQIFTQGFHPLEYRHGPISLIDKNSAVVMLHGQDQAASEASLVGELQQKGAVVAGFGGAGDVRFDVDCDPALFGLAMLPALQLIGERIAQSRNLDTSAPRHLTKVVTLT